MGGNSIGHSIGENMIEELYDEWNAASKPVILMGAGAQDAAPKIIDFAEKHNVPLLTSWNALDLIEWDHPNFMGRPGIIATRSANAVIQECDLLLSIGCRLDVSVVAYDYSRFAPKAKIILVDIDPGEGDKIPDLDWFVRQDAGEFIDEFQPPIKEASDWLELCQMHKRDSWLEGTTISYRLCQKMNKIMTAEDVLVLGCSCMFTPIVAAGYKQKKGQRVLLVASGMGSMGAALPSAIGVALASGKQVVCLDGDGSFCQNIQELEVVWRLKLPITFLILNNWGYASIRNSERRTFNRLSGADETSGLTLPAIRNIASGFGIDYVQFNDNQVNQGHWDTLDKYLHFKCPLIMEIFAPPDEVLVPRILADKECNFGNMWPYKT
jgi:acetolactate synthase-1/2/3 large subunit